MAAVPRYWDSAMEDRLATDLKRMRRRVGMTQLDVAHELDVTKNTICHWEIGRCFPRRIDDYVGWARAIGVRLYAVLRIEGVDHYYTTWGGLKQTLIDLREARGLSAYRVAANMGISKVSVCQWEHGGVAPRTLSTIGRWAAVLGAKFDVKIGQPL